jgi:hypothetical protein
LLFDRIDEATEKVDFRDWENEKILVTGVTGLLGRTCVQSQKIRDGKM